MASVTDIARGALSRCSLGTIEDINENSKLAADCRALWPAIRDLLLSYAEWDHARRRIVLTPEVLSHDVIPAGHRDLIIVELPISYRIHDIRWRLRFRYRDQASTRQEYDYIVPTSTSDFIPAREPLEDPEDLLPIILTTELQNPVGVAAGSEDGYIILTWRLVRLATDYAYRWRAGNDGNWTTVITTNGVNSATIDDLVNGQVYQFQVMALNDEAISAWSDAVSGVPSPSRLSIFLVPPAPRNLRGKPFSEAVLLEWNYVATATSYNYRFRAGESWTTVTEQVITEPQVEIGGLTNGVPYEFQVQAENAQGPSPWSDTVTVTPMPTAPAVPTGLTGLAGNTRARLAWDAVPRATGYDYRYRLATVASWTEVTEGSNLSLTIIVSGLTNAMAYHFSVRASSGLEVSAWSGHISLTPNALTPLAPGRLAATKGDGQVTLTFDVVTGAIDYDYRYRPTTVGSVWTEVVTSGDTDDMFVVMDLTNGTEYEFQVRANLGLANGGYSPWSNSVTATPQVSAPAMTPQNVIATPGPNRIVLTFDAVTGATDYDYRIRPGTSGEWEVIDNTVIIGTQITVSEFGGMPLQNGQPYQLGVRAVNAGGVTSWTDPPVSATPMAAIDVPAIPDNLRIVREGDQIIVIGFDASEGALDYDYRFRLEGAPDTDWDQRTSDTPADVALQFEVSGLTNGRTYEFQVRAGNTAGESNWSASVTGAPSLQQPDDVTGLTASAGDGSVRLAWNVALHATDYDERHRRVGTSAWTEDVDDNDISGTSYTVRSLSNGVSYEFQVRARNGTVTSAWTASVTATPVATVVPEPPLGIPTFSLTAGDGEFTVTINRVTGATGYIVGSRQGQTGTETLREVFGTDATEEVVVRPATNGITYYVRVRARDSSRLGPWSTLQSITPEATVQRPGNISGVSCTEAVESATLSWNADDDAADYRYRWRSGSTWSYGSTSSTSVTLTNLEGGTSYQFQVKGRNSAGESPSWSPDPPLQCTPDEEVVTPVLPADVSASSVSCSAGHGSATFSWSAADRADDYLWRYFRDGVWRPASATTGTSVTISPLLVGVEVRFQVRARNSHGQSPSWQPAGDGERCTPIATRAPDAPTNFRYTYELHSNGNSEHFQVNWDRALAATGYDYRWREAGTSDTWVEGSRPQTGTSITISSFVLGRRFEFQARATNSHGSSAWAPATALILEAD